MDEPFEVISVDRLPYQASPLVLQWLTSLDARNAAFALFAMRQAYEKGHKDGGDLAHELSTED